MDTNVDEKIAYAVVVVLRGALLGEQRFPLCYPAIHVTLHTLSSANVFSLGSCWVIKKLNNKNK